MFSDLKKTIISRLKRGKAARDRFVQSHVDKAIAYQIRVLRDHGQLSQAALAEKVGMNQNAISRLESPDYGKHTLTTLKRLAAAFDVGLIVRFAPYSELVDWASGTSYVNPGLGPQAMAVPKFEDEEKAGIFQEAVPLNSIIAATMDKYRYQMNIMAEAGNVSLQSQGIPNDKYVEMLPDLKGQELHKYLPL